MSAASASTVWSSVSTLPKTMSGLASDAFSKMGAKLRHGPHHVAQKSTNTMELLSTVLWKFGGEFGGGHVAPSVGHLG